MLSRLAGSVATLQGGSPFLGGKALERRRGRPFRARLGANECLFGVSPAARRAWLQAVDEAGYYNDPTHHDLRAQIADRWGVGMERIAVAEGIDSLLDLLIHAFVEPGDGVVSSHGAYPTFDYLAAGYGARLLHQPYAADWTNDLDGLARLARAGRAKLLFLANPDNPTGSFADAAALQNFLAALPGDCLLLLDEAYAEFAPAGGCLPPATLVPNLVRLRTFSKAYGLAGARVGYLVGPAELVERLDRIRLHFGVSKMSQDVALAAHGDIAFLDEVVAATHEANRCYAELARDCGLAALPSHANFVSIDFGDAQRAACVERCLEQRDIFVRRPPIAPLDRLIRVTAGPPAMREVFARALAEAVVAWDEDAVRRAEPGSCHVP